ncbi:MAG: ATPase, T2SS/T4P/T4SS family [Patescibacteria group bacterium]|jgi:type IV pilus assembly protein PilB
MSKKIITNLFNYAVQEGAEHLVISRQPQQVSLDCYLPDGELRRLTLPKKLEASFFIALNSILSIGAGELVTKKYHKIPHKNSYLPIYLTILPEKDQEKIIINLIKQPKKVWRLNQLGLRTEDLRAVKKILIRRSGLIIIGSLPGGGKSTTLHALLVMLNKPSLNLYFLGLRPLESIPGVNLLKPTKTNWEKIRRHDSDIILADSLDEDWALSEALLTAASGRLVIGTLTAANSTEIMDKIKKLPLPQKLKADSLRMIINQRLIPLKQATATSSHLTRQIIGQFGILKL